MGAPQAKASTAAKRPATKGHPKDEGAPRGAPSGAIPMPWECLIFRNRGFVPRNGQADREKAGIGADGSFDSCCHILVRLEKLFGVFAALADALAVIGEPGTGFFHDASLSAEIDQLPIFRDAVTVHDIELDLTEGRRH